MTEKQIEAIKGLNKCLKDMEAISQKLLDKYIQGLIEIERKYPKPIIVIINVTPNNYVSMN